VLGECLASRQLEPPREPAHPAEHGDRSQIEIAPLTPPGIEQFVHFVAHGHSLVPVENLDIKMIDT
jgi:hypothetical protein